MHELSLAVIRRLKEQLGSRMAIIGVGGVLSGKAAQEKMQAGADAVQLYTGLIYRGPALVGECVKAVAARAERLRDPGLHGPGPRPSWAEGTQIAGKGHPMGGPNSSSALSLNSTTLLRFAHQARA